MNIASIDGVQAGCSYGEIEGIFRIAFIWHYSTYCSSTQCSEPKTQLITEYNFTSYQRLVQGVLVAVPACIS